jgi:hypothetical protein
MAQGRRDRVITPDESFNVPFVQSQITGFA